MAKFEEILKAQGFTDDEITAQANTDPKVKAAIEAAYGANEETLTKYKTENDAWAKYNQDDVIPTVGRLEREHAAAIAEKAGLEARLKLAEQNGYAPRREEAPVPKPGEVPTPQPTFDTSKFVNKDDIAKFADAEGAAIAMAADLNEEYRHLTGGKSLFEYTSQTQDGRTLRGMTALRHEALNNKQHLGEYVAKKFDFEGKRAVIAEDQRKKAEEAIRQDERTKVMGQYGDPNQRPLMPSNNPFVPRPREAGKMPWEVPAQERARARITSAMQIQSKEPVN